jgi:ribonuclease P protein component
VRSRDVRRILDEGRAIRGNRLIMLLAPGTGRCAAVAGRRLGGAVDRNRAKRVLRAAWRRVLEDGATGRDAVLIARSAIRSAKSDDVAREMSRLLAKDSVT